MMIRTAIDLVERGVVPDTITRFGIRRLLQSRLQIEASRPNRDAHYEALVAQLAESPIALHSDTANEQHYEVPVEFFRHVMGQHLKYSAGYWPEGVTTLDAAEAAMLALTSERAELADGQQILELGCGWGSLSLWMASHYPQSTVVAVSNSKTQKAFIDGEAARRGLSNLQVITADMNDFNIDRRFDRVVSVEMFEHMRNYRQLMQRIRGWLLPTGKLFVHIFAHRQFVYPFEVQGSRDWISQYFFTGGLMPSTDLLERFQEDLQLEQQWWINGEHYRRTCDAWLANQDRHRHAIMATFNDTYGPAEAARWFQRWRMFFMACSELFGYRQGEEWGVCHYRFSPA